MPSRVLPGSPSPNNLIVMVIGTAALVRALGRRTRRILRPAPPATPPPQVKAMQPDDYQNKAIMPEAYAAKARRRER
jgi:hypothetical protein